MTSFLCSGSSSDGSQHPAGLNNSRDITSRARIMRVKVFLEKHFLGNISILCNHKDMQFFHYHHLSFTVWMPLISIKMTALNLSLCHLFKIKVFCLHIEGKRVSIIIPHPQLLRLNITGAKALSYALIPLIIIYHAAEERGQIESSRMLFTDSRHSWAREYQSWHN